MGRRGEKSSGPGEVAGDEGLAHELAVGRDSHEELKAIGKAGEDPAGVSNPDLPVDRRVDIAFKDLPESIPGQVAEWQVRVVLVVVPAHEEESGSEAVAQCLTPRNTVGSCLGEVGLGLSHDLLGRIGVLDDEVVGVTGHHHGGDGTLPIPTISSIPTKWSSTRWPLLKQAVRAFPITA